MMKKGRMAGYLALISLHDIYYRAPGEVCSNVVVVAVVISSFIEIVPFRITELVLLCFLLDTRYRAIKKFIFFKYF
jgi:hypothetical protein